MSLFIANPGWAFPNPNIQNPKCSKFRNIFSVDTIPCLTSCGRSQWKTQCTKNIAQDCPWARCIRGWRNDNGSYIWTWVPAPR
jgi:hypothetical protein